MFVQAWQFIAVIGIISFLVSLLSYRWGHSEGRIETLTDMLEFQLEEVIKSE